MASLQTLPESAAMLPTAQRAASAPLATRSFLYAVFKHRRLVLGVFAIVFIGSTIAALLRPRAWMATAKILVKLGETVQLAPAEAPSRSVNLPLSQEVVKTEADIVRSVDVVKGAVAALGIKAEDGTSEDELVDGLRRGLNVAPSPGTNVLQISFIGKNPEKAARMVNAISEAYLEHHNRVYRNEGMQGFYTEQLAVLETELQAAQTRLRDALRAADSVDVDQELKLLNQDALEQEKGVRAHRGKITATKRKITRLAEQMGVTPTQIPFTEEYQSNPTLQTFKNKLAELELERFHVLQYYMPTDRKVADLNEQIARVKSRLRDEQGRVLSKQTMRHNEVYSELQRNKFALDTHLEDFEARMPGLESRLESTRERLADLSTRRYDIENMQQDIEQKRFAYDLYFKRAQEARATEALKNQSMVNVSILEHAVAPMEPLNSALMPIVLGLLGGLALGAAMAVILEYLSRRLRFEEEVERYLELPVLAVIPDLETRPELVGA